MMNQRQMHPAEIACTFMQRAELKGGEVDAYAQTYNWLQAILMGESVVLPKEVHEKLSADAAAYNDQRAAQKPADEIIDKKVLGEPEPENVAQEASEDASEGDGIPVLPVGPLPTPPQAAKDT